MALELFLEALENMGLKRDRPQQRVGGAAAAGGGGGGDMGREVEAAAAWGGDGAGTDWESNCQRCGSTRGCAGRV